MLTRTPDPVVTPEQYAVVLVNGDQLDQLMRRPAMRQVNSRYAPPDLYARYQKLKRRMAVVVVLLALASGALLWVFGPQPAMASMFPWAGLPAVSTLHTAASFSVTIASLDSADGATVAASRVRELGLPAFTRLSPGKRQVYQAMVGPYASLDEAEHAQRRLGAVGYRGARLFVDESLRSTPRDEGAAHVAQANPVVALLGAPERLSLVLELESEPRQIRSSRPTSAMLEIDAGPMATPAQPQQWSAPDGVHLLHTVAIEGLAAPGGLHYLRARVSLPEFAKANVRNEGRRVYVDLTWPLEDEDARTPRRAAPAAVAPAAAPVAERRQAAAPPAKDQDERYRGAIAPLHQRIVEIRPFLLSAAQSGSMEVLAALDQTLAELESSLASMNVPASESGQHELLRLATRTARQGLEPGFAGDRLAHARQAISMFDGAMAPAIPAAP